MAGVLRQGFFGPGEARATSISEVDLQGVSNEAWSEKDCRPLGCAQFGLWLRCSSVTAPLRGMLPPRASPQAKLGATKHQPFRRHNTSKTSASPSPPFGMEDRAGERRRVLIRLRVFIGSP